MHCFVIFNVNVFFFFFFLKSTNFSQNTLKTAQELKSENKLSQVELIIFEKDLDIDLFGSQDDEEIIERYIFRVERDENEDKNDFDIELYIIRFEDELRNGLMRLEQTAKDLKHLNTEFCGFRINLETTESSYIDIVTKENSKSEVSS